jgi:hypothetical protein
MKACEPARRVRKFVDGDFSHGPTTNDFEGVGILFPLKMNDQSRTLHFSAHKTLVKSHASGRRGTTYPDMAWELPVVGRMVQPGGPGREPTADEKPLPSSPRREDSPNVSSEVDRIALISSLLSFNLTLCIKYDTFRHVPGDGEKSRTKEARESP